MDKDLVLHESFIFLLWEGVLPIQRGIRTMRKITAILLAVLLPVWLAIGAFAADTAPPALESTAAILMDAQTGQILYGKNMEEQRYPASITKIMTVLLALENLQLPDQATVSEDAAIQYYDVTHIGLVPGETVTVEQMVYAAMLMSANDACNVLAEKVAGSQEDFAQMMNDRAQKIGATGTHFTNPSGLPEDDHYTTAKDMALITREALQNAEFTKVFGTLSYTMEPTDKNTEARPFINQSDMMKKNSPYYCEGIVGGKLGWTEEAGNTMVTVAQRDGRELICVVLDCASSAGKYKDTQALLDYGFGSFSPATIKRSMMGTHKVEIQKNGKTSATVDCLAENDFTFLLHNSLSQQDVSITYGPPAVVAEGQEVDWNIYFSLPEDTSVMYPVLGQVAIQQDQTLLLSESGEGGTWEGILWLLQETGRLLLTMAIGALILFVVITILLLIRKWMVLRNRKKHRKMLLQKRAELERLRRKQYDIKL